MPPKITVNDIGYDRDQDLIVELHEVEKTFANKSFQAKTQCVTTEIAALTLIVAIFKDNLADSSFKYLIGWLGFTIPILYLLADITVLYFQFGVRIKKYNIEKELREKYELEMPAYMIEKRFENIKGKKLDRLYLAITNPGNLIYFGVILLVGIMLLVLNNKV